MIIYAFKIEFFSYPALQGVVLDITGLDLAECFGLLSLFLWLIFSTKDILLSFLDAFYDLNCGPWKHKSSKGINDLPNTFFKDNSEKGQGSDSDSGNENNKDSNHEKTKGKAKQLADPETKLKDYKGKGKEIADPEIEPKDYKGKGKEIADPEIEHTKDYKGKGKQVAQSDNGWSRENSPSDNGWSRENSPSGRVGTRYPTYVPREYPVGGESSAAGAAREAALAEQSRSSGGNRSIKYFDLETARDVRSIAPGIRNCPSSTILSYVHFSEDLRKITQIQRILFEEQDQLIRENNTGNSVWQQRVQNNQMKLSLINNRISQLISLPSNDSHNYPTTNLNKNLFDNSGFVNSTSSNASNASDDFQMDTERAILESIKTAEAEDRARKAKEAGVPQAESSGSSNDKKRSKSESPDEPSKK